MPTECKPLKLKPVKSKPIKPKHIPIFYAFKFAQKRLFVLLFFPELHPGYLIYWTGVPWHTSVTTESFCFSILILDRIFTLTRTNRRNLHLLQTATVLCIITIFFGLFLTSFIYVWPFVIENTGKK